MSFGFSFRKIRETWRALSGHEISPRDGSDLREPLTDPFVLRSSVPYANSWDIAVLDGGPADGSIQVIHPSLSGKPFLTFDDRAIYQLTTRSLRGRRIYQCVSEKK